MAREIDGAMNFQPIQLRTFAMLADEGNYSRVARLLSYSEPAIHMHIKALEKLMGLALVRRDGQRIVLTSEGLAVLPHVRTILAENYAMDRTVRSLQADTPFVIGSGRHSGAYVLMPHLREFNRRTGLMPELQLMPASELAVGLMEHRFEMVVAAISDQQLPRSERLRLGIIRTPWLPVRWVLVATPTVNVRRGMSRSRNATTVFYPDYADNARLRLEASCRRYFPDAHLMKMDTAEAVKAAVVHGLGAGVLPRAAVEAEEASAAVTLVGDLNLNPSRTYLLHYRPRTLSTPVRQLLAFLLDIGRRERHAGGAQGHHASTAAIHHNGLT